MNSYSCCQTASQVSAGLAKIAPLIKTISEENKLKILCILKKKTHCVCEIQEHLAISQSLLSHHLRDLRDSQLVADTKQGLRVYYSLTPLGDSLIKALLQINPLS